MLNKIYVKTPTTVTAGGIEALYQLIDAINSLGGNGIALFERTTYDLIHEKYKHYKIQYTFIDQIEDKSENMVIYPEVWTSYLNQYQNVKKAIWWLSVNNNGSSFGEFNNNNIYHFYQSYFAMNYLYGRNTSKVLPLFDYISERYLKQSFDIAEQKNIVSYNPAKGSDRTAQIMNLNPDIEFVPITGMTEDQIIELLKQSKVYIDFGHHPGKDRIPREAAHLGNCIITNKDGAAKFYGDIPINDEYKIENLEDTKTLFRKCFDDYENTIKDFDLYRSFIKNQKEEFFIQVKQAFL